ncbi:MAG: PAS domain S-box protein [Alphaproteobacteria bacterium]|nr:PAS domain S-box protein [Alphaproteobacteria bacterium]
MLRLRLILAVAFAATAVAVAAVALWAALPGGVGPAYDDPGTPSRMLAVGAAIAAAAAAAGWLLGAWIAEPVRQVADALAAAGPCAAGALHGATRYREAAALARAVALAADRDREQASRLGAALDASRDAIITIDDRGAVLAFNAAAERLFGYAEAEIVGRNVRLLMPEPYRGQHDGYLERYAGTGERRIIGIGRLVIAQRRDGSTFPCHLSVGEARVVGGKRTFTGFIRDVTQQHEIEARLATLQTELLQLSRLSALGQMGSQLAHELNQPLGAIANFLEASRQVAAATADPVAARARGLVEKALEQVARAGAIVKRMRGFVSAGAADRRAESPNVVVEEALALATVSTKFHDVRIATELTPGLPQVCVDRVQVQQVLLNLVRNAIEAMTESKAGVLTVRTAMADGMVEVSVADRGHGIAAELRSRLFSPFVTTKERGLGLGLSICRTIVEAHGGTIAARPKPGGGTVFSFTLPRIGEPDEQA